MNQQLLLEIADYHSNKQTSRGGIASCIGCHKPIKMGKIKGREHYKTCIRFLKAYSLFLQGKQWKIGTTIKHHCIKCGNIMIYHRKRTVDNIAVRIMCRHCHNESIHRNCNLCGAEHKVSRRSGYFSMIVCRPCFLKAPNSLKPSMKGIKKK